MHPVVVVVLALLYLALSAVTTLGSRRRGSDWPTAIAEGIAWPGAWLVWFVRDNRAEGRAPFDGHPHRPD